MIKPEHLLAINFFNIFVVQIQLSCFLPLHYLFFAWQSELIAS